MTEKVECSNPGCSTLILPETGAKTGGRCMPCNREKQAAEREDFVRRNRRDVDPFQGVQDGVEIIKIVHQERAYDPLINWLRYPTPPDRLYAELTPIDLRRLTDHVEALLRDEDETAEDILLCLAAFTDASLEACLEVMIERRVLWPSLPFRRASTSQRDRLLEQVEMAVATSDVGLDHALLALAWIGDARVVERFGDWARNRPGWASQLNLAPDRYSHEAGWELDSDGHRRDIFFRSCTALVKGSAPSAPESTNRIPAEGEGVCPWCGRALTILVDLVPSDFDLAGLDLPGLQVVTCDACTAFGTIFGIIDADGRGRLDPGNVRPSYLPNDLETWPPLPARTLVAAGRRSPHWAANWFLPTTFSQVGGLPTWIQDFDYPICPGCSRTMKFLAQIAHDEIEDHAEGFYYAFVCADCRRTATSYQQS